MSLQISRVWFAQSVSRRVLASIFTLCSLVCHIFYLMRIGRLYSCHIGFPSFFRHRIFFSISYFFIIFGINIMYDCHNIPFSVQFRKHFTLVLSLTLFFVYSLLLLFSPFLCCFVVCVCVYQIAIVVSIS